MGCLFQPFVKTDDTFLDEPAMVCRSRKEKTSRSKVEGKIQTESISEAPGLAPRRICSLV